MYIDVPSHVSPPPATNGTKTQSSNFCAMVIPQLATNTATKDLEAKSKFRAEGRVIASKNMHPPDRV
jgi:hypothetical protein